jgi:hypothetical protein
MNKEKLKDFVSLIPLFALMVYGLGFVIISGYLSQYNLVIDDLVNSTYIKAGIAFSILTVPIFLVLYLNFDEPTDNLLIAKKYYPTFLVNILTYLLVITFFIVDSKKLTNIERLLFILGLSIDVFTYLLATSILKNKKQHIKIVIQLIIPIIFLIYFGLRFNYLGYLYFIVLVMCMEFVLAMGVVADKKSTWGHYLAQIMWLVFISYLFGNFVYGNLPSYLGGGSSFSTTIIAKEENNEFFKKIGLSQKEDMLYKVEILYSSSDKYLIRSNDRIFFLSKNLFEGFVANSLNK